MTTILSRSVISTLLLLLLLCGVYPLVVSGIGNLLFRSEVRGGFVTLKSGQVVGARLIGQSFTKPQYFHGRPSAAGSGYDAAASSGSNLGPTSKKLRENVTAGVDAVLKENPDLRKGQIPVDLVTASASGLDPHISPESAYAQVGRVAAARRISPVDVRALVQERVDGPQLGIFGEPTVNVLILNLALDQLSPQR